MSDLWYQSAIIYSLDVERYFDSNNDGVGDFKGLIMKLDYLASLGINCLWILPFYPSPHRDNGYDVKDYYTIDPQLGTLGDFVDFLDKAKQRNIKVIVDLVVNHTSIQHPWFQEARRDKKSRYRKFYVWSDQKPEHVKERPAFPGEQSQVWTYDEKAEAYYLHRFYKEQPDLNVANPEVKEEIRKIIRFWLQLGVAGFRIDAATMIVEQDSPAHHELKDHFDILNNFKDYTSGFTDVVLLAEANDDIDKLDQYFGRGDRMNMLFNFIGNQNMFLALARKRSVPLEQSLKKIPDVPTTCTWLNFGRHHDELTLDKLTPSERQEVFDAFAPNENMQIFGRGIRRRLAPMLKNERKRIEQVYSLIFSTNGVPMIRYGDEIGMGDDLELAGRESVRTVMQWKNTHNGGFSDCSPEKLIRPTIIDGEFSYKKINVEDQEKDKDSHLNWIKKLIQVRKECPEIGSKRNYLIEEKNPDILAYHFKTPDTNLFIYHNLSEQEITFSFKLEQEVVKVLLSDSDYEVKHGQNSLRLQPFGYLWIKEYKR